MKHVNAREVFEPNMVKQVQKYYSGGYLWIPKQNFQERRAQIHRSYATGEPVNSIAKKYYNDCP